MMKMDGEALSSDQASVKPRRSKSREVSSRFLSPSLSPSIDSGTPSPKPRKSTDTRKHRSKEDGGFIRGLWPSTSSQSSNKKLETKLETTLADHLGNERLKDLIDHKSNENSDNSMLVNRQRSCSDFSRFRNEKESTKENHRPLLGGSMRYTGTFRFPGRSSTSSSKSPVLADDIVPGRFSVDENALRRKSVGRKSDSDTQDSESECSDICSGTSFGSPVIGKSLSASYMASTVSSRKSGIEVPSKYMHDLSSRRRRGTSDPNIPDIPVSSDNSPKKFTIKNAMKRANSLSTYGSASKWALSPGRSGSPSMENMGKPMSFSSLRPPTSPSRAKGVGNLLSMGLELFKSKKSSSNSLSPLGPGTAESVHQLRMLHNKLVQWRYANARADVFNRNVTVQAENNLVYAWHSLAKLQYSVMQKQLQLQKEKQEEKLNFILHSQIKPLEAWADMERQHQSALSMMKDCLHSVVCKVPLIEGAEVEPQSASIALRHSSDLAASIKSMLSTLSPATEKTASMLSQLAEVVAGERALLEECLELIRINSTLEVQERSLKCNVIQLKLWQQQQQQEIAT
ncbi:hypothetical protein F0562_008370 [Nyssa sinensis]|uniref:QWRF motif-containing protein 3 n=1 Tax=Nyssa sinensis TaxID=561372 RepID=A0A5J5AAG8_9ASTE|nr:hypothetical protein F0562_008370 [Nyssa sinensis]